MLVVAAILSTARGYAQSRETLDAKARFQEGLRSVAQGDVAAALVEFEAAYSLSPHYSVLYNVGQAQAQLGRPLDAAASFRRYLEQGGEQIGPERRQRVQALIEAQEKRLGRITISVRSAATRVWVNGVELLVDEQGRPKLVEAGRVSLLYAADGEPPSQRFVDVPAAGLVEVEVSAPPLAPVVPRPGILSATCAVPGVSVEMETSAGVLRAAADPQVVPSGPVKVRFSRLGYIIPEQVVTVEAGRLQRVECAARVAPNLAVEQRAHLQVRAWPHDAAVKVDGETYTGGALPVGTHHLSVAREGFVESRSLLDLPAGRVVVREAKLTPNPATRQRWLRVRAERHGYAYVLGGVAAALLMTSGGLHLWNADRYERWQAAPKGPANLGDALSIQRVDDLSLGLLLGGLGSGVGAAVLFFGESPQSF